MPAKTKIGIIGCGTISDAYFKGCAAYDILEVAACADIDIARARTKAAAHGIATACPVAELLANPEIEIVVNLTIPQAHVEINMQALAAGKHVYVEKPFALTTDDGVKVLVLARERGLRVGCAPDTFLGTGQQTARRLLDSGAIGRPVAATAFMLCRGHETWHPAPAFYYARGGGPMFDMGPYYLTALVNLLGPIKRVSGSAQKSFAERKITSQPLAGTMVPVEVPTHYAGTMDFADNAVASIVMSFDVYPYPFPRIVIFGTEGTMEVPDPNDFDGEVRIRTSSGSTFDIVPNAHAEGRSRGSGVADLAHAIRNGRKHRASGELALHVVEAMEAFEKSSVLERHVHLDSRAEKPAALPETLKPHEFD